MPAPPDSSAHGSGADPAIGPGGISHAGVSPAVSGQVAATEAAFLRLLVVEDSDMDYELLLAMLGRDGLRVRARRVEDEVGMRDALTRESVDAVITDHNMPRFDSFASLQVAKTFDPDLPVLVVSGEMSEELAVAALHAGADDFILKSRQFRLVTALRRSLAAAAARRERRAAQQALAESEAQLRALTGHLESVKEDERHRIAREIHDDIGSTLTAMKFELARLARELQAPLSQRSASDAALRMPLIMDLLAQAVGASHRIQYNLRPPVLDAGLVAAVEWLTRSVAAQSGLRISFESNRTEIDLAPERAAAVYRVAQESLTNVTRHAGARQVNVQLFASSGEITLEVTDDGAGFDTQMLRASPGFGVRGLIERARGLGGWAEVSSAPGRGTTVMFSLPHEGGEIKTDRASKDGAMPAAGTLASTPPTDPT